MPSENLAEEVMGRQATVREGPGSSFKAQETMSKK
jgi:hypothetical protein